MTVAPSSESKFAPDRDGSAVTFRSEEDFTYSDEVLTLIEIRLARLGVQRYLEDHKILGTGSLLVAGHATTKENRQQDGQEITAVPYDDWKNIANDPTRGDETPLAIATRTARQSQETATLTFYDPTYFTECDETPGLYQHRDPAASIAAARIATFVIEGL